MRTIWTWFDGFILSTLRDLRDEQREQFDSRQTMRSACLVLAFAGLMLVFREEQYRPSFNTLLNLLLNPEAQEGSLSARLRAIIEDDRNWGLAHLMYWSLWQFLIYVILPACFIKLILRERLVDYGIKIRGATKCWWAYLAMYLSILPFVLWMAGEASFRETYPFFEPSDVGSGGAEAYWQRFWIWECFYALQFISLEFFFRGFLLHGTKRAMGIGSVYIMMIPYCMIHFGKPLPETIGALIAGLVLGFMSLKTRSIWLGAASHIAVAITMDLSALAISPPSD